MGAALQPSVHADLRPDADLHGLRLAPAIVCNDHVIGALHFQTFLYLLTALILAGAFTSVGPTLISAVGFGAVSLYLVRFLRVAYGSG
ncbi:MAG: hypothetical protein R3C04_00490 [Hyphomonas sp.]